MTLAVSIAQGASNNVTFRNRIINGACVIDQRYAGGAISAATLGSSGYTLDRWKYQASQSAKFSAQQNAGSVAVQATTGFANYLGFTSVSAYSITSTDYFRVMQPVEGFNGADLAWGTASAKTITISFWVYSSITGTYGIGLQNNDNNRGYVGSYTISSASTWEQKSVTIAGDTSGTWKTDNNIFAQVAFYFGAGSSQQATPGSWSATVNLAPTGQANVSGTNGATFYITGVQLEAGTTASPFEYRQYGTELALCQRYYYRVGGSAYSQFALGFNYSTTGFNAYLNLPVTMRIVATNLEYSTLQTYDPSGGNYATNSLSVSATGSSNNMAALSGSFTGPSTSNYPCILRASNSTSGYIALNAEL